jgi:hypothetical protein
VASRLGIKKNANLFYSVAIGTIAAVESPFHSLTLTLWSLSGGRTSLSLMTAEGAAVEASVTSLNSSAAVSWILHAPTQAHNRFLFGSHETSQASTHRRYNIS